MANRAGGAGTVLFISTVFPFPADNGKKVVTSGIVRYFLDRVGADRFVFLYLGSEEITAAIPFRVIRLARPSLGRNLGPVAANVVLRGLSLQEALIDLPAVRRGMAEAIAETAPELIVCDMLRTSTVVRGIPLPQGIRTIAYLEDLLSERYRRLLGHLATGRAVADPLGAFAQFVPAPLRRLAQPAWMQRLLFSFEAARVERAEIQATRRFDRVLLVNDQEVAHLKRQAGEDNVGYLRPAMAGGGQHRQRTCDAAAPLFVFLGALNYQPNAVALERFIDLCADRLAAEMPEATVMIVGRFASARLTTKIARHAPQFQLVGFVEDLGETFARATAMIIPLELGTGVKLKTLEALRHGLPVLSTTAGVEGVGAAPGVHVVVEDDLSRFPEAMRGMTDPQVNAALSAAGQAFFTANYDPDRIHRDYDLLFGMEPDARANRACVASLEQ